MSSSYFMTPEERVKKKKRNKAFLYTGLILFTALFSTVLTVLLNKM
ncbi:hypothetical protein M3181_18155 [Mesobacillus maritimus]|nr:hypothetical protein [Mesobacillus maritimus]MCM3670886.1 hypothetical protein [Mesobacillus maritimus]